MDADKKSEDVKTATPAGSGEHPPAPNALAQPNDEATDASMANGEAADKDKAKSKAPKKLSPLKKLSRRFNIYLLLFGLVIVIGGGVVAYSYITGKKAPPPVSIANQTLTQGELKQLANSNATVGGSGQTLTVQGNTVFSGNVLIRSNLNVAGAIQLGSKLDVAQFNVSGSSNLATTQANTLQVAGSATFQGVVTIQNGLAVNGNASINAATIGTITANKVIMSGNAQLEIPNHISFSGSAAPRIANQSGLGGGSASINGTDTSGTVTINTGGSPAAGCMVGLTFSQAYFSTKPNVILSLESSNAVALQYYAGSLSTTGFNICSANAPPANQQIAIAYFITASAAQ